MMEDIVERWRKEYVARVANSANYHVMMASWSYVTVPKMFEHIQSLQADNALTRTKVETLFDAIAHGDDEHKAWLKQAIADHFAGLPVQPVAGKGNKEALQADNAALLEALQRNENGWENAINLRLLPPEHIPAATILRDEARALIEKEQS